MKISHFRKLNKNERYPTTKKLLKSVFANVEQLDVLFGLNRTFESERKSFQNKMEGTVVASVTYHRDRTIHFSLFPQSSTHYTDKATEDFNTRIMMRMKQWIEDQMNKPDTALLSMEELIVEWDGRTHLLHMERRIPLKPPLKQQYVRREAIDKGGSHYF
ncbi:hypothetical protein [Metabacillus iocasae]|uniref:Uncharacterized protein n=1 Tax=Priestia iocasae TaxID=2291674 RepID=A0ABS2QU02_9BACI|nr:hypothetical protein [Metabacillus iocasae]MBM7702902.1 hypothetical protein [Metabacillus iocasae]